MTPDTYTSAQPGISTPRALEYTAFSRATTALSRVQSSTAEPPLPERLDALHRNLMLWDVVLGAVADPQNALPEGLRGQIAYLARFTRHYTKTARNEGADLQPLIDINIAVMKGLRGIPANAPQPLAETA